MKIRGPGQPPIADGAAAEGAEKAAQTERAIRASESPSAGEIFSEKLTGIAAGDKPGAAQAPTAAQPTGAVPVSDVARDLRAGNVTPETAVDKVVERVLTRQLGPDAPAAVRDRVRLALQDALENDPTLAEKLTRLH